MQKNKQWFCMLLVAISLVTRNYTAFQRPEFWAEDGAVFFKDSLELGWGSLFIPLGGYQNLISRMFALTSVLFFSLEHTPFLYVTFSLFISSFIFSYIVSDSFKWIISSDIVRILLCFLFSLAPGVIENSQALCNLHPIFGLFLFLFLLKNRKGFSKVDWVIWMLFLFSTPEVTILIPVIWLLHENKKEKVILLFSIILITGLNGLQSKLNETSDYGVKPSASFSAIRIGIERLTLYLFLIPVFGKKLSEKLFVYPGWIFWPLSLVFLSKFFSFIRKAKWNFEIKKIFLVIAWSVFFYFCIVILSRPYLWSAFSREAGVFYWDSRYSFIAVTYSLLFWAVFLPLKFKQKPLLYFIFWCWFSISLIETLSFSFRRPNLEYEKVLPLLNENFQKYKKREIKTISSPPIFFQPNKMGSFTISIQP